MRDILILCSVGACLFAQHAHQTPPPPTEKPVALLAGLGTHVHPIATPNPLAQKFFDQGLNLLYGFNRYEALRSFRKAAELDPRAPMPLWGIAMALGPHINMDMDGDVNLPEGCAALTKAAALRATVHERAYLDAALSRCPSYQPARYIQAMHQLQHRYPDDLDAASFYAESLMIPSRWQWWQADGLPAPGMAEAVSVLERVMRRQTNHPGANHFYIHAVEMSPTPERAIPSAQRLMGIVPAAGHLVHMPGHIWLTLGDWDTAAAVNERAAQVDREYFARTGVQSGYVGYFLHNLHFVAYARAMQGRARQAIAEADTLIKEAGGMIEAMPEMADAVVPYPIFMRMRFQHWQEILSMPKPSGKLLATTALWHWARAIASVAQGDRAAAQREAELFGAARAKVPPEYPWLLNKAAKVLAVAEAVLGARMAADQAAAVEHWRRAVRLQDELAYDEPPPWYMPLRESLGGALLRSGAAAAAETVFREGLRRSPRNGRMLFGLLKALEASGQQEAAALVRREFTREWTSAGPALRIQDL